MLGARDALGASFCGAYLQGSFAVGDADLHSDVDFVVVTEAEVMPEEEAALQADPARQFAEYAAGWAAGFDARAR